MLAGSRQGRRPDFQVVAHHFCLGAPVSDGEAALLSAFLLSGFLYDIDAMPLPLRLLTRLVPARYYVSSLQTLFLAGDVGRCCYRIC
jgi:hypothetical protein